MDRKDLQSLSRIRAREAKALLDAGLYDGAFYLAGYAVECALKACIAKATRKHEFPDKDRVNKSYTHSLVELIRLAGLRETHDARMKSDPVFRDNWGVVVSWSEDSRYLRNTAEKAEGLVNAVGNPKSGVLSWLRHYW
ncbi:MAG: HEPN domain-containing protein [Bryobacteraceae bacterium]